MNHTCEPLEQHNATEFPDVEIYIHPRRSEITLRVDTAEDWWVIVDIAYCPFCGQKL